MTTFLGNNSLHIFLRCTKLPNTQTPNSLRCIVTYASLPARDKTIDFGKYKGRMLGTLPSTYLKWVSNNLRARDFEEWAKLADQVLEDPVYKDRVEWEFAQKLLNGDVLNMNTKSEGVVSELLEMSKRFGWDNEDKVGWSKVDFTLLGTSKGGRIPRMKEKRGEGEDGERWRGKRSEGGSNEGGSNEVGAWERRVERRDRLRMKSRESSDANAQVYRKSRENSDANAQVYRKSRENSDANAQVYRKSRENSDANAQVYRKSRENFDANAQVYRKSVEGSDANAQVYRKSIENSDANAQVYRKSRENTDANAQVYRKSRENSDANAQVCSPFPGRETLLKKVLNRRRIV